MNPPRQGRAAAASMVEPFVVHYSVNPVIHSPGALAKLPCLCRTRARTGEALTFGGRHSSIAILSAS
jgi:hypothetical protein